MVTSNASVAKLSLLIADVLRQLGRNEGGAMGLLVAQAAHMLQRRLVSLEPESIEALLRYLVRSLSLVEDKQTSVDEFAAWLRTSGSG